MSTKDVHVVPRPDGSWGVKREGAERSSKVTDTQREAIGVGRTLAERAGSELVIHGEDGRIREKNTYGKDPHPPKG